MKKAVYEIIDEFKNATTHSEKVSILKNNATYEMKNYLQGLFHPNINFVFTEPLYFKRNDMPVGFGYSTIHQELSRIYLFIKDHPKVSPNLTHKRKVEIATQMLESLEPKEADMLMYMLLKKPPIKELTYKIVQEAFPDLLPTRIKENKK